MNLCSETVNGLFSRQTERQTEWMNEIYFPPWCRAGPYFVGVLLGYALYRVNGRLRIHPVRASLFTSTFKSALWHMLIRNSFCCRLVTSPGPDFQKILGKTSDKVW